MDAHVHHFILVPEALPQVAQIGHDDDPVGLALQDACLLQRVQRGPFALQGRLTQPHHVRQLGEPRNTDQQPWAADPGGAALLHLLQTAGAQLLRAALAQRSGHLRQAVHALHHAAHADVLRPAAADDLLGVAAQDGQIDLKLRISALHGDTSYLRSQHFYCSIKFPVCHTFFPAPGTKRQTPPVFPAASAASSLTGRVRRRARTQGGTYRPPDRCACSWGRAPPASPAYCPP